MDYARYAGLGVQFAGALVLFGALGRWADGKLGTDPWLMVAGIFLGFVGGMVSVVKSVPPTRSKSPPPEPPDQETPDSR